MELTVLGRFGLFPRAGGACSGYLVQSGETCLALEMGSGVLSRLLTHVSVEALDAVLLSHLHYDHCSDLLVLQYLLELRKKQGKLNRPLRVYAPETPAENRALLETPVFEFVTITDGMRAAIGALNVTFRAVRHPVEAYAMDMEDASGRRLFYTGDTRCFDALAGYASGVDALLADTAFVNAEADRLNRPHMCTGEVSRLAKKAGVGMLLCTHLSGDGASDAQIEKEIDFTPAFVVQEQRYYKI